jgi:hypothetical protein
MYFVGKVVRMSLPPLPELITLDSCNGDWNNYLNTIYDIFCDEIVKSRISFLGLPVKCQYRPETQGKHFGFWHLISEGHSEEDRTPDFRRCERIRWISYIINNSDSKEIHCWENKRGSNRHIVLWLPEEKFVVVLARRKEYVMLKTAYVHHERKTSKFEKESRKLPDPRND